VPAPPTALIWSRLKGRLPIVELPVRYTLFDELARTIPLDANEQRFLAGYEQENAVAIGILPDTARVIHVLWMAAADSWLPAISTFSKTGSFLAADGLVIGHCDGGSEPCSDCKETVIIGDDYHVMTTDTVHICECDSNFSEIPGTCEHYVQWREGNIGDHGVHLSDTQRRDLDR